jgi:ubiquitin-protein ligase E3 C
LLGKEESFLDDLESLDPDLWRGLVHLKHYTGNPQDLHVNFTVAVKEGTLLALLTLRPCLTYIHSEFGVFRSHELIRNGSDIDVTRENRLEFIQLLSQYHLSKRVKLQSEAFFKGLLQVIDTKWFRYVPQSVIDELS